MGKYSTSLLKSSTDGPPFPIGDVEKPEGTPSTSTSGPSFAGSLLLCSWNHKNGNLGPMKASKGSEKGFNRSLFWIQAIKKTGYLKILWLISSFPIRLGTSGIFRVSPLQRRFALGATAFPTDRAALVNPMNQHARIRPESRHFPNVLLGQFLHALFGITVPRCNPQAIPSPGIRPCELLPRLDSCTTSVADAAVCSAMAGSVPVTSTAEVVRIHFSIWISVIACAWTTLQLCHTHVMRTCRIQKKLNVNPTMWCPSVIFAGLLTSLTTSICSPPTLVASAMDQLSALCGPYI